MYRSAFVFSVLLPLVAAWDDLVMPPLEGKNGTAAVFLFGQGASIPTELYEPLGLALQQAAPYPLWFASPQCLDNVCSTPGTLASGMTRVKEMLASDGCDLSASDVFYGGHSLGGAMMPDYVNDVALNETTGMVLMGSFLTRKWKTNVTASGRPQVAFPVPTMTIGAELDGLCRVTRISEALYSQVTFAEDPSAAVHSQPVAVVQGMNHYQFASGNSPPLFVKYNDLTPEIDEATAHAQVASNVVPFLTALRPSSSSADVTASWTSVESSADASAEFVQPIVNALLMEGYMQFTPPCYCETPDEYFYYSQGLEPPYDPFDGVKARNVTAATTAAATAAATVQGEQGGRESTTATDAAPAVATAGAATTAAAGSASSINGGKPSDKLPFREFGTCLSQPNCTGGVPWTAQHSVPHMAGAGTVYSGLKIRGLDSLHIVTEENPSCHLPHVHGDADEGRLNFQNPGAPLVDNNWNPPYPPLCSDPNQCELNVSSVTQHTYENAGEVDLWRIEFSVPSADTGYRPIAARELKTKMKSREALWEAAGVPADQIDYNATDVYGNRCQEINQAAIDWALAQLPPTTAQRFATYGQQLLTAPDLQAVCPGGPCWIWDPLRFDKDDANATVTVRGVTFSEPNYNLFPCGEAHVQGQHVPCPTGFHYCKLLSPAKALEWMYVDGLRLLYSGYK